MAGAASYLKFLWNSKNQHGVHSPFIFALVTRCFYNKAGFPEYQVLKQHRNALLNDTSVIHVTDYGAGSRVFKSNAREVRRVASNAGISKSRSRLLFRLVRYFNPKNILEIGTSLGLATAPLYLGCPDAEIITLEGCPETAGVAKRAFEKFGFRAQLETVEFSSYLNAQENRKFDFIYFDGNHSKEATLSYFESLLPTIGNDTVWIFDDIHWSDGMEEAWEIIKSHPKVTVTIDTFQWGLVFFRDEQQKEHFTIRI